MGRKGSRLWHFLQDGLIKKKYKNLFYVNDSKLIFSINLPHKTKKLNEEDEQLFKDWYDLKNEKYVFGSKDYTLAKQAIIASLKKSDYFEKVPSSCGNITYRILTKPEIEERKGLIKELKKQSKLKKEVLHIDNSLSSLESEHDSGIDSLSSFNSMELVNDNLITSGINTLSQASKSFEASNIRDLKDALPLVELSNGKFTNGESPPNGNSINPLINKSIYTSCNELSPCLEENFLSDMNLMDCNFENPTLNHSALMEEWNFLQATNISGEELNDLILKDIELNLDVPTSNDKNLHIHTSEMQSICELPMECQDISNEELNNKQVENTSAFNPHPSVAYEENIPEQISSSQSL